MRGSKVMSALVVLLAVGLVAGACSKKKESEGGQMTIGSDKANDHGTKTVSGASFKVEVDSFYFEPTVIKGTPGQKVTLMFSNDSSTLHNFTLQAQSIDTDIQPKSEGVPVSVTFPQSGFLEFFCKYHKSQGMVGELST